MFLASNKHLSVKHLKRRFWGVIKGINYFWKKFHMSSKVPALEIFTISSDKSDRKWAIGNFFSRYSSQAHLPPALRDSLNLTAETRFNSKLSVLVDLLKRLR